MSIFDHNKANIDIEKEILEREMQKTYLEGILELRKEELEADFNNLFEEFNDSVKNEGPSNGELYDRLDECRTSLSRFFEVRSELLITKNEIEYAKGELKELEEE